MGNDAFFDGQSDLTSAKIKIYKEYIEGYLPKLLMTFGSCVIIDLFCGSGKNGDNKGSPLVLLDRLDYILKSPQLKNKRPLSINILFNDIEKNNIQKLESELNNISYDKELINITLKGEDYESYIHSLVQKLEKVQIPKFIFLDPFSYSDVKMDDLNKLMELPNTEVLLFIPIFHSYRFASKDFNTEHKTRKFVEEFTIKGVHNYKSIYDFTSSVKNKIKQEIGLKYVRPILIEGGGRKNSLFLLTKHPAGMILMNKVAAKNTVDGNSVNVKEQQLLSLFDKSNEEIESSFYSDYKEKLIKKLKSEILSNEDIVSFTIEKCFLPKHAKKIITELFDSKRIIVTNESGDEIGNRQKWNIAEKINKLTLFKWVSN